MFRLVTLVFHFAYGFRHFFSLMKKRTPKKIKAVPKSTILLSRYGGSEKNSPFYSANGLRPIVYRRAQTLFLVVEPVETLPPSLLQNRDFDKADPTPRLATGYFRCA
jgi:hypothetical protein